MVEFRQVTMTYPDADAPVLRDVSFELGEGELILVVGPTGAGKSTLLSAINGLVPHFTGGRLDGQVIVAGRDTRTHPPRELADVVGYVGQDPAAGFVTEVVEDELAYAMEWLGLPPTVMRRRVEDVLDLLDLARLRGRRLDELSGGEQQRVAIGSVLTAGVRVLVLDEPTSALDPPAAEEVLAVLTRLVHDLGLTVVIAEHRLERVIQYADRILRLPGDGSAVLDEPSAAMAVSPLAPPVVHLARLAGWHPVPLSIREARRYAARLRATLPPNPSRPTAPSRSLGGEPLVAVRDLVARYGTTTALRHVNLRVERGEVVALMGRNGSGKTTLLTHLAGLRPPARGEVIVDGVRPHRLRPVEAVRHVTLVPAEPSDLFVADSVAGELRGLPRGRELLRSLAPEIADTAHPRDLSAGGQLLLALAIMLSYDAPLLLLDEPTRGLDYAAKERLAAILRARAEAGRAVVLATHDVELAAEVATRTVVLADGEVVADGPTAEVVTATPAFAPQVARILHPLRWLTVGEVREALEAG
ncbi:MAG: ATP-binding cassette domain-containing protein [Acidothermus sp.]|nr:ATP-binding cassette domain-containing protein [Acidothermus sp.]